MTTDSAETLREKALEAAAAAPFTVYEITHAALDAVGFETLLKERDELWEAQKRLWAKNQDDFAVDALAAAMKTKLAQKRAEGYSSWQDQAMFSRGQLSQMLREHVEKGDPVDVANFCMMLHQRGEQITNMKLNPPETAPKDGTGIIAVFDDGQYLHSAVWNYGTSAWLVAFALDTGHFAVCAVPHNALTGWLPMPQIDDEGNVR